MCKALLKFYLAWQLHFHFVDVLAHVQRETP